MPQRRPICGHTLGNENNTQFIAYTMCDVRTCNGVFTWCSDRESYTNATPISISINNALRNN